MNAQNCFRDLEVFVGGGIGLVCMHVVSATSVSQTELKKELVIVTVVVVEDLRHQQIVVEDGGIVVRRWESNG